MITKNNTHISHGDYSGQRCAEASEVGLPPGEWPAVLSTTLGNSTPFYRGKAIFDDIDYQLILVRYVQKGTGLILEIFND